MNERIHWNETERRALIDTAAERLFHEPEQRPLRNQLDDIYLSDSTTH